MAPGVRRLGPLLIVVSLCGLLVGPGLASGCIGHGFQEPVEGADEDE